AEDLARDTTALIRDDLRQKPSLNIVDSVTLPQKFINPDEPPKFAELRSVGLRFIVVGRAIRDPRGRAMLGCRLWDVSSEQQVKGQWVVADEWQRAGHGLAEIIYDALAARLETVEVGK